MPPAPITPDQLRDRAQIMRRLASRLDTCLALDVRRRAGPDTWLGATPTLCHDDLVGVRTTLRGAVDDLRSRARTLDQRAAQLDVAS